MIVNDMSWFDFEVLQSCSDLNGNGWGCVWADCRSSQMHCLAVAKAIAPCANVAEVPGSLKKELGGVCKACFSAEQVSKHGWEMQQHREVRQQCDVIYTCNSSIDN
eukprot:scaffold300142_cov29-Prasinocladus_malaysianus.AAC.1